MEKNPVLLLRLRLYPWTLDILMEGHPRSTKDEGRTFQYKTESLSLGFRGWNYLVKIGMQMCGQEPNFVSGSA